VDLCFPSLSVQDECASTCDNLSSDLYDELVRHRQSLKEENKERHKIPVDTMSP